MIKSRGSSRLALILALGLLFGAGCDQEAATVTEPQITGTAGAQKKTTEGARTVPPATAGDPGKPDPGPALPEKVPAGATVARRLMGSIHSLDPLAMSLPAEEDLARYLYGSLYLLQGDPATGLPDYTTYHADALPETLDHQNYTIRLKEGLTWSDGSPLTAQDYVDSLEMLLDPRLAHPAGIRFTAALPVSNAEDFRTGRLGDFTQVGFQAVEDTTITVRLDFPRTPLDVSKALAQPFLIHRSTYDKFLKEGGRRSAYGDSWKKLIYGGPYLLAEYEEGSSVWLEKRRDPVLAAYDSEFFTSDYIWLRSIPDRTEALAEFQNGWLDVISAAGGAHSYVKEDPRLKEASSNTVWGLYVNTADGPRILSDPNFRQALYYGIDRTRIAVSQFGAHSSYSGFIGPLTMVQKPVIQTTAVPGSGSKPEGAADSAGETRGGESIPGIAPGGTATGGDGTGSVVETLTFEPLLYRSAAGSRELVPKANVVDLKRAREFAGQALDGLEEVQTIELTVPAGGQFTDMAQYLKESIESLFGGELIEVVIRELPLGESQAALLDGSYELGFGGMGQDLFDPFASLAVYTTGYGEKFNTFSDARFDELYLTGYQGRYFKDHAQYMAALHEMEAILLKELPMIPLFVDHGAWLVQDGLELPFEEPVPGLGLSLDGARRLPRRTP